MGTDKERGQSAKLDQLRRKAEERLSETAQQQFPRSEEEMQKLVHELEVHQVELEMQNEVLRHAKDETEIALQKYADLYDFAPVGYVTLDRSGTIRAVNLAGSSLLGVVRSRLNGPRFDLFVTDRDRSAFIGFLEKVFASQTKESCEVELLKTATGGQFVRIEGVAASSGEECRIALLDITLRKQALKELMDKNTELERFTYTVSHDLKSPLITIQSYAGMIRQDLENGRYSRIPDDLNRISAAAKKMGILLDDLLELSRVGRVMDSHVQFDMNRMVQDVLEQLSGFLQQNQVKVDVQPDLPSVLGDRKRIAEALQNLVENAIKYRGSNSTHRITIGVRKENKEQVFFVNDNGIGIDPRYHETIFGLFKKLDAKSDGTGIGLALVKRIIEVHGGRVWVESEGAGSGSTFCFTLPDP